MGAVFDDLAVLQDDDSVEAGHRRQPVGDDDRRASFHQVAESFLDHPLALGVQRRGRLVEDEDGRIGQDGAGDGDALPLSAGQFDAPFAGDGLEAFRELLDELEGVGLLGRLADLLHGGVRPAVRDILRDGPVEQEGLLGHVGDLPPQRDLGDFRNVLPVDADASFLDVRETQEQFREGGLAGTGPADEADALSGGDGHREVFEDVLDGAGLLRVDLSVFSDAVGVLEAEIIKADLSVGDVEVHGVRNVVDQAGLIEVLGHFGGVAEAAVDDRHGLVDHVEPKGQVVGIGEDQDQRTGGDAVPGVAARDEDGLDDHDDDDDAGGDGGAEQCRVHAAGVRGADLLVGLREEVFFIGFPAGGLDGEDVRDAVGQFAGEPVLGAGGGRVAGQGTPEQEPDHDDVDDEDGRQDDDVERDERRQHDDGQDRRGDERHQRVVEELHQRGVGVRELRRLGDQRAAEPAVVEGHALVREGVEDEGGEVVVAEDLEFPDRVVLEL